MSNEKTNELQAVFNLDVTFPAEERLFEFEAELERDVVDGSVLSCNINLPSKDRIAEKDVTYRSEFVGGTLYEFGSVYSCVEGDETSFWVLTGRIESCGSVIMTNGRGSDLRSKVVSKGDYIANYKCIDDAKRPRARVKLGIPDIGYVCFDRRSLDIEDMRHHYEVVAVDSPHVCLYRPYDQTSKWVSWVKESSELVTHVDAQPFGEKYKQAQDALVDAAKAQVGLNRQIDMYEAMKGRYTRLFCAVLEWSDLAKDEVHADADVIECLKQDHLDRDLLVKAQEDLKEINTYLHGALPVTQARDGSNMNMLRQLLESNEVKALRFATMSKGKVPDVGLVYVDCCGELYKVTEVEANGVVSVLEVDALHGEEHTFLSIDEFWDDVKHVVDLTPVVESVKTSVPLEGAKHPGVDRTKVPPVGLVYDDFVGDRFYVSHAENGLIQVVPCDGEDYDFEFASPYEFWGDVNRVVNVPVDTSKADARIDALKEKIDGLWSHLNSHEMVRGMGVNRAAFAVDRDSLPPIGTVYKDKDDRMVVVAETDHVDMDVRVLDLVDGSDGYCRGAVEFWNDVGHVVTMPNLTPCPVDTKKILADLILKMSRLVSINLDDYWGNESVEAKWLMRDMTIEGLDCMLHECIDSINSQWVKRDVSELSK